MIIKFTGMYLPEYYDFYYELFTVTMPAFPFIFLTHVTRDVVNAFF